MKIAFFGTSEFGAETLKQLHENFGVEFVVTGVARQANRGKKLTNTPIFELATSLGIKMVYTPEKLTAEFEERLKDIDFAVVVSFGMILPERILNSAKNFVNLHPSSLPLFRGAAPIERTIEAGHTQTDVCVIKMTKKLDAGNIIARQSYEILESDDAAALHEKFAQIGANLIVDLIKNGAKMEEIQSEEAVIYAKKIEKSELELKDFSNSTIEILNKIRAFSSCGYCFKMHETKRFKFILAQISHTRLTKIDVECTDGFVSPLIIRPEGRGNLGVKDYQF